MDFRHKISERCKCIDNIKKIPMRYLDSASDFEQPKVFLKDFV